MSKGECFGVIQSNENVARFQEDSNRIAKFSFLEI